MPEPSALTGRSAQAVLSQPGRWAAEGISRCRIGEAPAYKILSFLPSPATVVALNAPGVVPIVHGVKPLAEPDRNGEIGEIAAGGGKENADAAKLARDFGTGTCGFATAEDARVAVCLLPGTELAFRSR